MWRRLLAMPVFDSRVAALGAGTRGGRADHPRLLYTVAGFEVDLQVRPGSTAGRISLRGQVLDEAGEPSPGWATIDGAFGSQRTALDENGEFAFDGLISSGHRVEIGLPHTLIEIPTVYV